MPAAPSRDIGERCMHRHTAILGTAFGMLLACVGASAAEPQSPNGAVDKSINVLILGNSLSYVNNLPALFNAIDASQPGTTRIHADLLAAPGGSLSERWTDGVAAQEIASGKWQVLVLQERGGTLACLAKPQQREEATCRASAVAHREFSELARKHGMRVVLLGTWGPDSIWQAQLGRGLRQLAGKVGADALDVGAQLRAHAKSDPATPMTQDAMGHPSLDGSLLIALSLYESLAGHRAEPKDLVLATALLPPMADVSPKRLVSTQAQLQGDGAQTQVAAARLRALQP